MGGTEGEIGEYRTEPVEGVWYSLGPSVLPPDDRPGWVDLHRHQEDGVVVLGRFRGAPAAMAWARERFGVAPAGWRREGGDG